MRYYQLLKLLISEKIYYEKGVLYFGFCNIYDVHDAC